MKKRRRPRVRCIMHDCQQLVRREDIYETRDGPVCRDCHEQSVRRSVKYQQSRSNKLHDEDSVY